MGEDADHLLLMSIVMSLIGFLAGVVFTVKRCSKKGVGENNSRVGGDPCGGCKVNLRDMALDIYAAAAIAGMLRHADCCILALVLTGNQIGIVGANSISDALKTNNTITFIGLAENHIDDEGGEAIAEALALNTSVTQVFLWGNSFEPGTHASFDSVCKLRPELRIDGA